MCYYHSGFQRRQERQGKKTVVPNKRKKSRRWIRTVAHITECALRVRGVFKRRSPVLREPDSTINVIYGTVSCKKFRAGI